MRDREEAWHSVESQAEQNPLYSDFSDVVQASSAETSLLYSSVACLEDDGDLEGAEKGGMNGAAREVRKRHE